VKAVSESCNCSWVVLSSSKSHGCRWVLVHALLYVEWMLLVDAQRPGTQFGCRCLARLHFRLLEAIDIGAWSVISSFSMRQATHPDGGRRRMLFFSSSYEVCGCADSAARFSSFSLRWHLFMLVLVLACTPIRLLHYHDNELDCVLLPCWVCKSAFRLSIV
jgi:hypothetical protein